MANNRLSGFDFANSADINMSRSVFENHPEHSTTFNVGELVPIYCREIYPGDSSKIAISALTRLTTLLRPNNGNLFQDFYAFFVPNRLVWNHWKEFLGENNSDYWTNKESYSVPTLSTIPFDNQPANVMVNVKENSIADHLGLPLGNNEENFNIGKVNALPFRAFALIYNDWFRNENVSQPIQFPTDDSDHYMNNATNDTDYNNYILSSGYGGVLPKVAKVKDYFTSVLPSPQKGDPVTIAMVLSQLQGQGVYSFTQSTNESVPDGASPQVLKFARENPTPQAFGDRQIQEPSGSGAPVRFPYLNYYMNLKEPVNLGITINDLRFAFALQKFLERQARGGTRYVEFLLSHFGVQAPDASLQNSQLLGGCRMDINIQQVVQNSQSTEQSPLGNLGGISISSDHFNNVVDKSFTEHGFLIIVTCVRYKHTYTQGINRSFLRTKLEDYYVPEFANIGEQPVYKAEIYANESNNPIDAISPEGDIPDNLILGYNEAWSDLRYEPSLTTGLLRPQLKNGLDSWTISDYYEEAPTLSHDWIVEDVNNIDRVLALPSSEAPQIICQLRFDTEYKRVMPSRSIPGLIDHH